MEKRLFPITHEFFTAHIQPVIERSYARAGRPPKISSYAVFCAMLYVLRTGIPWRDLPPCYGPWNEVYQRFKRSADRGVWWRVLMHLQQAKQVRLCIVLGDSTTFKSPPARRRVQRGQQSKGRNRAGVTTKLHVAMTAEGHRVSRIVRRAASGADEITWDPTAGTLDPAALAGVDAVVNLAGAAVRDAGTKDKLSQQGLEGVGNSPREFAEQVAKEIEQNAVIVQRMRASGTKID